MTGYCHFASGGLRGLGLALESASQRHLIVDRAKAWATLVPA